MVLFHLDTYSVESHHESDDQQPKLLFQLLPYTWVMVATLDQM